MFTVGSACLSTLSIDISTNTQSIYRPSSGRHSVDISTECRSIISRESIECLSSAGRVSADTSADMCVGRYGFSLLDTRPIPYRYFTDSLPIPYRYSVDTLPILGPGVG